MNNLGCTSDIVKLESEHGNTENSLLHTLAQEIAVDNAILDIGCHYGSLLANLYFRGFCNVIGVETDKGSVDVGIQEYPILRGRLLVYDGNILPFADNCFDVVLMFDVLEHIPDLQGYLFAQVVRVLKPEGLLIFQTPNKLVNIPWEILNNRSLTAYRKYHCSLQTYRSLKRLLGDVGLEETRIEKMNVVTEHNKRKVKARLGIWGIWILNLLNKMPLPMTSNFYGTAKKPLEFL